MSQQAALIVGIATTIGLISSWMRTNHTSQRIHHKKDNAAKEKEVNDHIHSVRQAVVGRRKVATCRRIEAGQEHKLDAQSKIIHFVRHAEGIHNVAAEATGCLCADPTRQCPYSHPSLVDPKLTEKGRSQVISLQSRASQANPELIVVSPHVRTIESALLAFEKCNGIPFLAVECAREHYGKHICDKRNNASDTKQKYQKIDMSLITEEDTLWTEEREPRSNVIDRSFELMEWLKQRPEKNIAVVSHSSFLLTLMNACVETEDESLTTWFETAEMRSVALTFH